MMITSISLHPLKTLTFVLMGAILLLGQAKMLFAEENHEENNEENNETVRTPLQFPEDILESTRMVQVQERQLFSKRNYRTTPEILDNQQGLSMIWPNAAWGSPLMRGLMGQRVLILVDGVRLNNAMTPWGPNSLLSTVDPFNISRIEILEGPGAVLYGSDAMGGVINILTRSFTPPDHSAWGGQGEIWSRYYTADRGGDISLGLSGHLRPISLGLNFSLRSLQNRHAGDDRGEQENTGFDEEHGQVSAAWAINQNSQLQLSYLLARQNNLFLDPNFASIFSGSPQVHLAQDHVALHYTNKQERGFIDQIETTLSYQRQEQSFQSSILPASLASAGETEVNTQTLGLGLILQSSFRSQKWIYGVDLYRDWINSPTTPGKSVAAMPGRIFIDDASYLQGGLFVMDHILLGEKWAMDLGGRIQGWQVNIPAEDIMKSMELNNKQWNLAWSAHGRYLLGDGLNLIAGVGQAFHAPNVYDHLRASCSTQGSVNNNPELTAERSITAEAGGKFNLFGLVHASLLYFVTFLPHAWSEGNISAANPSVNFWMSRYLAQCNNTGNTGEGISTVNETSSVDEQGFVQGVDFSLEVNLTAQWNVMNWTSWSYGTRYPNQDQLQVEPMSLIPPLKGTIGVRYHTVDNSRFAELLLYWAAPQHRLGIIDQAMCAVDGIPCSRTPAYAVFTLRGGMQVIENLNATIAIHNLSNTLYRTPGSAVDGPGLSVFFGLEATIP